MKYILTLFAINLLLSCSQKEDTIQSSVNLRVNHYKQSAIGEATTLVFLIQEEDMIGTEEWSFLYSEIVGFNFEWGFVYDLVIDKKTIENPPQGGSSTSYILREIISKEPIAKNQLFEIQLKSESKGINNIVVMAPNERTYSLFYEQTIDCLEICDQLNEALKNKEEVIGIFTQGENKIRLSQLEIE